MPMSYQHLAQSGKTIGYLVQYFHYREVRFFPAVPGYANTPALHFGRTCEYIFRVQMRAKIHINM